ncbi:coiled-coil domain-containing protein [Lyticum sinuosum]|uniref:Uncharacterized protein n=1 Tax=Lyticum sinuosum TaxID=1332059 RepID=A0AAE5AHY9_9RICK|nr:hypothetical protein [Lyticum sinuosum]MDZ5761344.1 hypothetical protein [Lyticum sinuosum]
MKNNNDTQSLTSKSQSLKEEIIKLQEIAKNHQEKLTTPSKEELQKKIKSLENEIQEEQKNFHKQKIEVKKSKEELVTKNKELENKRKVVQLKRNEAAKKPNEEAKKLNEEANNIESNIYKAQKKNFNKLYAEAKVYLKQRFNKSHIRDIEFGSENLTEQDLENLKLVVEHKYGKIGERLENNEKIHQISKSLTKGLFSHSLGPVKYFGVFTNLLKLSKGLTDKEKQKEKEITQEINELNNNVIEIRDKIFSGKFNENDQKELLSKYQEYVEKNLEIGQEPKKINDLQKSKDIVGNVKHSISTIFTKFSLKKIIAKKTIENINPIAGGVSNLIDGAYNNKSGKIVSGTLKVVESVAPVTIPALKLTSTTFAGVFLIVNRLNNYNAITNMKEHKYLKEMMNQIIAQQSNINIDNHYEIPTEAKNGLPKFLYEDYSNDGNHFFSEIDKLKNLSQSFVDQKSNFDFLIKEHTEIKMDKNAVEKKIVKFTDEQRKEKFQNMFNKYSKITSQVDFIIKCIEDTERSLVLQSFKPKDLETIKDLAKKISDNTNKLFKNYANNQDNPKLNQDLSKNIQEFQDLSKNLKEKFLEKSIKIEGIVHKFDIEKIEAMGNIQKKDYEEYDNIKKELNGEDKADKFLRGRNHNANSNTNMVKYSEHTVKTIESVLNQDLEHNNKIHLDFDKEAIKLAIQNTENTISWKNTNDKVTDIKKMTELHSEVNTLKRMLHQDNNHSAISH